MNLSVPIYWRPSYPALARDKTICPFCHSENFKSPGPCKKCGIHGYHGAPPGLYRGKVWRRKGRDYEPEAEEDQLSLEDLDGIDIHI